MNKAGNSPSTSAASTQSIGYIVSPRIDFWMTGGASIVVMCLLLVYIALHGASASSDKVALLGNMIIFQAIINWPHFMGAYSLLYRPSENIKKYKFASIYVPMALIAVVVLSVLMGGRAGGARISVNQDVAYLFWLAAAFYLAWHYTGQAWGMIATFSRLSNAEIMPNERFAIRIGLRFLLVWHVVWGAQDLPAHWLVGLHPYLPTLLSVVSGLCCAAFAAGLVVWARVTKRMSAMPDARILASWVAIYLWYLVLNFMPEAYPIVQLSHALQYLPFPLRVELNRATSLAGVQERAKSFAWSAKYYLALIVAGLVIFYLPEAASDGSQKYTFAVMIASAVSIHHYFVDGCIWRISNADIRRSLFSHLSMARPPVRT